MLHICTCGPTIVFIYTHLSFCCCLAPHCKLRGNKNHNVTLTFSWVKLSGNTRCRASSVPVSRFSDQRRSLTSPRDIFFRFSQRYLQLRCISATKNTCHLSLSRSHLDFILLLPCPTAPFCLHCFYFIFQTVNEH